MGTGGYGGQPITPPCRRSAAEGGCFGGAARPPRRGGTLRPGLERRDDGAVHALPLPCIPQRPDARRRSILPTAARWTTWSAAPAARGCLSAASPRASSSGRPRPRRSTARGRPSGAPCACRNAAAAASSASRRLPFAPEPGSIDKDVPHVLRPVRAQAAWNRILIRGPHGGGKGQGREDGILPGPLICVPGFGTRRAARPDFRKAMMGLGEEILSLPTVTLRPAAPFRRPAAAPASAAPRPPADG